MQQAAVIVEPRNHALLPLVIFNARAVLGAKWQIFLFHGTKNIALATSIQAIEPTLQLRNLGVDNLTVDDYSALLCRRDFWESIPTLSHILVFQTDALLSEHSPYRIEMFLPYDYVGALWVHYPKVGNGGLSLRRKSAVLRALAEGVPRGLKEPEDLYFAKIFANRRRSYRLAPEIIAGKFSVERIMSDTRPFAIHAAHKKLKPKDWQRLVLNEPLFKLLENGGTLLL